MTAVPLGLLRTASDELSQVGMPAAASARLIERAGRDARIERDGWAGEARIAFGCLVQPEPGDRVLTSTVDGTIWIVAVLERHCDAPAMLWAEGNIDIVSARGDVSITAAQTVDVRAGALARVAAPEIHLHAGVGRFVVDELLQVGRRLSLYVAKLRSVGEIVETFAEHVLTRAQRGSRFITESDQLRAGSIDQRAEGTLQLRAETAFITADTVVRVDAEQIHMG